MKITKQALKQIIKESIEEVMQGGKATLPTSAGAMSLGEMVKEAPDGLLLALQNIAVKHPELAKQLAAAIANPAAASSASQKSVS